MPRIRGRGRLAYHLVLKCHYQKGFHTMNGLQIFIPAWPKHRHWRKNAKSHHKYHQQNQLFFKPDSKISNIVLHNWCYSDCDFTQLPHLLHSFRKIPQLDEWKDQSTAHSVLNCVNIFCCRFENSTEHCNHGSLLDSAPLVWDTHAGLTPYRAHFFNYVDINIPVKDVTKTNNVVFLDLSYTSFRMTRAKMISSYILLITCRQQISDHLVYKPTNRYTTAQAPLLANRFSCIWKTTMLLFRLI